jgi:predicted regulator of Ras-like GTPase activity (Roadblock/LC7/MglB family)
MAMLAARGTWSHDARRGHPAGIDAHDEAAKNGGVMSPQTRPVQDLNWLITNFVQRVPSVAHSIVVSSDGLPLAFSEGFPTDRVDQLAAVTSGLISLTQGAARVFEGGPVTQTVVEMERGLLLVMAMSDGSSLAVLASTECDMGLVAYEMTLLVEQVGRALTPDMRAGFRSKEGG